MVSTEAFMWGFAWLIVYLLFYYKADGKRKEIGVWLIAILGISYWLVTPSGTDTYFIGFILTLIGAFVMWEHYVMKTSKELFEGDMF